MRRTQWDHNKDHVITRLSDVNVKGMPLSLGVTQC